MNLERHSGFLFILTDLKFTFKWNRWQVSTSFQIILFHDFKEKSFLLLIKQKL